MSNLLNLAEAVDLGIEKEKKRREFYALVAENFEQKEMKELFTKLRDWESGHIEKFSQIRDSLKELETVGTYPGEYEAFMQAFIDDKLYKDISADMFKEKVKSPIDAINYGMSFEKDAIIFFNEILNYIKEPHKEVMQKLIDEEKKHLIYLSDLRSKV